MDHQRIEDNDGKKMIPALGRWGRFLERFYDFLDAYVRDTPNAWLLPLLILLNGVLSVGAQIADLVMMQGTTYPMLWKWLEEIGMYDASGMATVKLVSFLTFFLAPVIGLLVYWVGGGIAYAGVYLLGYRGFVETRRFVFYFHLALSLFMMLIVGLMYLMKPIIISAQFAQGAVMIVAAVVMVIMIVTVLGSLFLGYLLFKGFEYLLDMTMAGFLVASLLWVVIFFVGIVVCSILCVALGVPIAPGV